MKKSKSSLFKQTLNTRYFGRMGTFYGGKERQAEKEEQARKKHLDGFTIKMIIYDEGK